MVVEVYGKLAATVPTGPWVTVPQYKQWPDLGKLNKEVSTVLWCYTERGEAIVGLKTGEVVRVKHGRVTAQIR